MEKKNTIVILSGQTIHSFSFFLSFEYTCMLINKRENKFLNPYGITMKEERGRERENFFRWYLENQ